MHKFSIVLMMVLMGVFTMGTALALPITLDFTDNGSNVNVQLSGGGSGFLAVTTPNSAIGSFLLGGIFSPGFTVQANIYESIGGAISDTLFIKRTLGGVIFKFLSDPLAIPLSGNVISLVRNGTSQLIASNIAGSGLNVRVQSSVQSVPEPSATVFMGISLFVLGVLARKKLLAKS